MSRFQYRSSDGELAFYDDSPRPGPQRWDRERFERFRQRPEPEKQEVFRFEERESPRRREVAVEERVRSPRRFEEERVFEEERIARPPRRFFEEPTPAEVARTALTPYRRKSIVEREVDYPPPRPARPQFIRRQSSLDTFDRRPMRYAPVEQWRPPPNIPIPLPIRRRSVSRRPYYRDDDFEEIRYRDLAPDGGDELYEDIHIRRERTRGPRHRKRKSPESSKRSSSTSSFESVSAPSESAKSDKTDKTKKTETKVSIKIEEKKDEPKLPGKKGKTRMPKRLVKKQAIIELGYPFEEEEDFLIITRALGKEHIDEVIKLSEKYKDDKVIYRYEEQIVDAPPPAPLPPPPPPPPPPAEETIHKTEIVIPPDHHHHHHRSASPSARSATTVRSRSRHPSPSPSHRTEFVEERIVEHDSHVGGPLTVVVPKHRSERDIRAEIRALELERRALRMEREVDERRLIAERVRDRDDYDFEIIERRDRDRDVVRVEKDRKGRMALVKSTH